MIAQRIVLMSKIFQSFKKVIFQKVLFCNFGLNVLSAKARIGRESRVWLTLAEMV